MIESREQTTSENATQISVIESKKRVGDYQLLVARNSSPSVIQALEEKINTSGIEWFSQTQRQEHSLSRRKVCIFRLPTNEIIVVKQKERKDTDTDIPQLKLPYFTQSIVHEFRTSYLMHDLMQKIELPQTIEYQNESYELTYEVQKPLAAILNMNNPNERLTVFEYIPGDSVRDDVAMNGGWQYTSEEKRKLYGEFHQILKNISPQLVEHGLEPWDLGAHQLVYSIDRAKKSMHLGILDTEEYNLSAQYGQLWPESYDRIGLPVILPFL